MPTIRVYSRLYTELPIPSFTFSLVMSIRYKEVLIVEDDALMLW
jgi:hypothetical protein